MPYLGVLGGLKGGKQKIWKAIFWEKLEIIYGSGGCCGILEL